MATSAKKTDDQPHSFINPDNGSTLIGTVAQFEALSKEQREGYEDRGPITHADFVVGTQLRDTAPQDVMTTVIDADGAPTNS